MLTTPAPSSSNAAKQLAKWLGYLEQDPHNPNLLQQAASSAFDAGQPALCQSLIGQCASQGALPPALVNLQALVSLSEGDFEGALKHLASLEASHHDPVLRYNMAYANAMLERYEAAGTLLDETVFNTVPTAVTLAVRVAHHQGELQRAIELGERHAQDAEIDAELPGALASACFDAERLEDARRFALLAPDASDSQTVLGLLALRDGAQTEAQTLLHQALAACPTSGRAMLGVGLCQFAQHDFERAALTLDSAASALKRHAGSWVAAAWAHLYKSDLATARARFEHAAAMDRGLAEAPGGLAVIACREGRIEEAGRLITIALRLDRNCLAAALASSMLAAGAGDQARSEAIMQRALSSPVGADGRTLAELISLRAI